MVFPKIGRGQCFPLEGVFGGPRIREDGSTWWAGIRGAGHPAVCGTIPPGRTVSGPELVSRTPKAFM